MPKAITHGEFVRRAMLVHGDDYDYRDTNYVNMTHKVSIRCPLHGVFTQMPQAHLKGQGCPVCGREKQKQSVIAHFGVDNPMKDPSVQAKARETCKRVYGHEWAMSNGAVQSKKLATNNVKYGGNAPLCSSEVRARVMATVNELYHTDNVAKVPEFRQRMLDSKHENGTFHVSQSEDDLYELLCNHFGESDVERQHASDLYPFSCDFYVKSRKLYIELNGTWSHDMHWFDGSSGQDQAIVQKWLSRGTKYYRNVVHNWTVTDVKKRKVAAQNSLNYVVFWYSDLRDAKLWFAMGCPDGRDYEREYSWIPEEEFANIGF